MTVDEFANSVKTKYPQYKDLNNMELTKKVISKYPVYATQVDGFEPKPAGPSLTGRLAAVGTEAANRIKNDITGQGSAVGQSSIRRGVDATAAAFGTVLGGANALLPNAVQDVEKKAATAGGGLFHKITDLLSPQVAVDFVTKHPKAAKALEETLGTVSGVGAIAGDIAGAEGVSAGAAKTASGVGKTLDAAATRIKAPVSGATKVTGKSVEDAINLTAPTLGKKQTISAFERAGKPGGVSTETGFSGKIKYEPTQFDREVAQEAAPFISKSKNPAQNNFALGKEIERFSQEEVTPFLEANPRATNVKTVEKHLKEIPTPDLFKTDQVLEKTYNLVRQKMINRVRESGGNTLDLWNARKAFDRDVIKEFGDVAFDDAKATPIRRAIQDMRQGMNDYIGSQIGDGTFKNQLQRLSRLYEAQGRIAQANYKVLGSSKFKRWAAQNPEKANLIKYAVPAGLSTLGVGSLISN